MRKSITRAERARIFENASGVCHLCELRIQVGQEWQVEHPQALGLGGADDRSNMKPAHFKCHQTKTSAEKSVMSKADRQKWRHLGIKRPRTIRSWRKFNGQIVTAPRER